MQNKTEEEKFSVMVWTIDNFICYDERIHENVIVSPKCHTFPEFFFKLHPKGVSGSGKHMLVQMSDYSFLPKESEVSYVGPDQSLIFQQQCMPNDCIQIWPHYHRLPCGPKFEHVVKRIKDLNGHGLTLRYRSKGKENSVEYIRTTIHTQAISFKVVPKKLSKYQMVQLMFQPCDELTFPLKLVLSKDCSKRSEIALRLEHDSYFEEVLVRLSMTMMINEDVVKEEESENLFLERGTHWTFFQILNSEVAGMRLSVILHMKFIFKRNCKHSLYTYGLYKSTFEILPTGLQGTGIDTKPTSNTRSFGTVTDIEASPVTVPSEEPSVSMSKTTSENSLVSALVNELMCLYQDQDHSDFVLKCDNVTIPVHKAILSARSPVFKSMLSCDMQEAASGCMDVVDMHPSTLSTFLIFLYTGGLERLQSDSALNLYYAADKYQVLTLKKECTDFLIDNVSFDNVCDILCLGNKHQDSQLITVAHNFVLKNFNQVLSSEEWKYFTKKEPIIALETVTIFAERNYIKIVDS